MPRTKTGITRRKRHKKILKATKGFFGARSRLYKRAHEAYIMSGEHSFFGRKLRKRDMRALWIVRINAALQAHDLKYSRFINLLNKSKVELDRKILAKIAIEDDKAFEEIISTIK